MFVKGFLQPAELCAEWPGAGADKTGRGRSRRRAGSYEVTKFSGPDRRNPGAAGGSLAGQQVRQPISGSGRPRDGVSVCGGAEVRAGLAGDVTLEAADDFFLRQAVFSAAFDVGAGGWVGAHAGEHDPPQGMVGLAVAARVEPVRTVLPEDAGIGAAAHRCAQAASERSRSGWSPAAMSSSAAVCAPIP
jgi:hypothetical protein